MSRPKGTTEELARGLAECEELREYAWPQRGGIPELKSLRYQAKRVLDGVEPTAAQRESVLEWTAAQYPHVVLSEEHIRGFYSRDDIARAISHVNLDGSPGLPLAASYQTKGEALAAQPDLIADAVDARLCLLLHSDLREGSPDAYTLFESGLADPVRLFIKNEPHPKAKVDTGRLRLISSRSLVDELVERVVFGALNELEIEKWTTIPSKPGMGLSQDEQVAELNSYLDSLGRSTLRSSDVSGWDWNVKGWCFEMDAERRIRQTNAGPTSMWARLARNVMYCLARSVFVLSDGRMFAQLQPGIMKSGSYLTSSSNSAMRVMLARLVGAEWCFAMGDDAVESCVEGAVGRYEEYGFRITGYSDDPEYEFCSHRFVRSGIAIPLNGWKGLFRLLSHGVVDEELLCQFRHEYRHDPLLGRYLSILRSCLTSLPPSLAEWGA